MCIETDFNNKGYVVNLIVALSNVAGLPLLYLDFNWFYTPVFGLMIVASVLMHLSEQKHGLTGIYPFSKYSNLFLWFDRIMAWILTIVTVHLAYTKYENSYFVHFYIYFGIFGLIVMTISEMILTDEWFLFTIFHSLWHMVAYATLYLIYTL
jgi:hypothetical protein